jgi:hypothetical protein
MGYLPEGKSFERPVRGGDVCLEFADFFFLGFFFFFLGVVELVSSSSSAESSSSTLFSGSVTFVS